MICGPYVHFDIKFIFMSIKYDCASLQYMDIVLVRLNMKDTKEYI
jgi:hypothetical protein